MPIKREDGKELSGAQRRRLQKESAAPASVSDSGFAAIFADLPPPPIGQPIDTMLWCNDALLLCVNALMRGKATSLPEITRLRLIMDGCAKAGMIRDKTAESKAMLAALKKREEAKQAPGLEPYDNRPDPPPVPRPTS